MWLRWLVKQIWALCVLCVMDGSHRFISANTLWLKNQIRVNSPTVKSSPAPFPCVKAPKCTWTLNTKGSTFTSTWRTWRTWMKDGIPCHPAVAHIPKTVSGLFSEGHHTILISAFRKKQHKLVKICSKNLPTSHQGQRCWRHLEASTTPAGCHGKILTVSCMLPSRTRTACVNTACLVCSTETHPALGFLGLY